MQTNILWNRFSFAFRHWQSTEDKCLHQYSDHESYSCNKRVIYCKFPLFMILTIVLSKKLGRHLYKYMSLDLVIWIHIPVMKDLVRRIMFASIHTPILASQLMLPYSQIYILQISYIIIVLHTNVWSNFDTNYSDPTLVIRLQNCCLVRVWHKFWCHLNLSDLSSISTDFPPAKCITVCILA